MPAEGVVPKPKSSKERRWLKAIATSGSWGRNGESIKANDLTVHLLQYNVRFMGLA